MYLSPPYIISWGIAKTDTVFFPPDSTEFNQPCYKLSSIAAVATISDAQISTTDRPDIACNLHTEVVPKKIKAS